MAELKPCPFCGGEAKTSFTTTDLENKFEFGWIGCQRCRCFINYINNSRGLKEATEAWNRRTTIETNIYDKEEIYPNCTVQVLTNTVTGEVSVGWWKNGGSEPTEIDFDYGAEDE